jgi:uncharacterized membrane protein YkvA (DUF1232 family)
VKFVDIKGNIIKLKNKIAILYLVYKHKDTPIAAKIIIGITLGYALSPIDLIPDFIPILGYLDDIIILPLLILISVSLVPKNIILECEEEAKEIWKDGKPKKWYYGLIIILVWVIIIISVVNHIYG